VRTTHSRQPPPKPNAGGGYAGVPNRWRQLCELSQSDTQSSETLRSKQIFAHQVKRNLFVI